VPEPTDEEKANIQTKATRATKRNDLMPGRIASANTPPGASTKPGGRPRNEGRVPKDGVGGVPAYSFRAIAKGASAFVRGSIHCSPRCIPVPCPGAAQRANLPGAERLIVEATNEFRRDEGMGS